MDGFGVLESEGEVAGIEAPRVVRESKAAVRLRKICS